MTKKVLVTGANGFVGNYVTNELLNNGADVIALNGPGLDVKNNKITNICVDILDIEAIKSVFRDFQPDCIIHLAAIAAPTYKDVAKIYDINVHGSENILDAAKASCKEGTRVILTSTAGVYGDSGKEYTDENTPYSPQNHYSYSKMVMEYVSRNYKDELDIKIIRPFNMIGIGQSPNFIVSKFTKAFIDKVPVLRVGNLNTERDFFNVEFAAKVFANTALKEDVKYDIINICAGKATTGAQILDILKEITDYEPKIEVQQEFLRKNEVMRMVGDTTRCFDVAGDGIRPLPVNQILKNMVAGE